MNNYVLKIVKKVFEKDDQKIEYYEYSTKIDGENFRLSMKDDDKKLANYLLSKHKFNDKGEIID